MAKNSNIVLTKTFSSYGINIVNTYSDFDLIGKELISSPLVYFYNSFGKAIFDYSGTVNTDDLDLLELFLQGITNGNTFSVSNGYYVKEQDGITSNINGIYQFDGATGNNIILTTVISATGINNAEYRYENEYFTNPPKLDLNTGFTGDIAYIIKSVTNEGEIAKLGLYEDDLIEISYAGNTANIDRLNVEKVENSTDGEEFIFVKEPLINDNRIGTWTTINVYTRGDATTELLSSDRSLLGASNVFDKNGNFLACYNNQNELQSYLRKFAYADKESYSIWGYGGSCRTVAVESNGIGSNLAYDKIYSVKYNTNGFIINDIVRGTIDVEIGKKILLYQGHFSNFSLTPAQIVFTRVKGSVSSKNLMSEYYFSNGIPGKDNSYTILTVDSKTPSIFYYENLNSPDKGGMIRVLRNSFLT